MKKRIALAVVTALGAGLLIAAPASAAQTVTLSQSAIRAGVSTSSIKVTLGTAATASESATAVVAVRYDSVPTSAAPVAGTVRLSSAVATGDTYKTITDTLTVAGTYAVTFWYDLNANSALDAGEAYGAGTITVGGTPAAVALSATTSSAVVGVATDLFTTSATDASGRATALTSGEFLNFVYAKSSTTGSLDARTETRTALGAFSLTPADSTTAGTYTITVTPGGTLPGTIAAQSHSVTVLAAAATNPTDIKITTTANVKADVTTAGARQSRVNSTVGTVEVKATGATAGKPVVVAVTTSGTLPSSLKVNGTSVTVSGTNVYVGTADADGAVVFTLTASTTSLNGKSLTLTAGSASQAIAWESAVQAATESDQAIVVDANLPTTLTVTVADQYGNAGVGYIVSAQSKVTTASTTTGGAAVNALGQLVTAITGADGIAVISVPAAANSISGTVADVLYTVVKSDGSALATPVSGATAYAVSYLTGAAITSVSTSLPTASTSLTSVTVPFDGVPTASSDAVSFTVSSNPATYVKVTAPAGVFLKATTAPTTWKSTVSEVTVASGSTVYAWSTKPGTYALTASAGGQSATGYFKVVAGGSASARNVAVAVSAATLAPNAFGVVTVSATDAFGNAVAIDANDITVTASGNVLLQGNAITYSSPAASTGSFQLSYLGSGAAGTGAIKVVGNHTTSHDQYGAAAGYVFGSATVNDTGTAGVGVTGADLPESVASASTSVTVAAAAADTTTAAAIKALQDAQAKAALDAAAAAAAAATAAKANADAIAAVSSSVLSLQTTVAALVASMTAQIKVINATMLKIQKQVTALQKAVAKK